MALTPEKALEGFNTLLDRIMVYRTALVSMYWDNTAGISPGGVRTRAKAIAALSVEIFKMRVGDEMKGYLDVLDAHKSGLDELNAAKHRIMRKEYYDSANIPPELIHEVSAFRVESEDVWKKAKNADDFGMFAPYLKRGIGYAERLAKLRAPEIAAEKGVYNALLDGYEPGMNTDALDGFFGTLRQRIIPLLKRVTESGKVIDRSFVLNPVSIDKQREIARVLSEIVGYDLHHGNISETEHPCCMSVSKYDVRIFTHYHENDFLSSVYGVLHECGHAIYDQGSSGEIAETVLDGGRYMSIHESQSRFYENMIGRSEEFWNCALPKIKHLLGGAYKDVTPRMMYEAANTAVPGLIRVEADELTYALHVMVRYEIEKEIFTLGAENVDVMSLPQMWNDKYQEYLGLTPPDYKTGVLQDVHWSGVMFGYFPSYALGSAYAAHMLHYMKEEMDVNAEIGRGNIAPVTAWLNEHIHRHGSVYEPVELFARIKGEKMNADYLADYLEEKYAKLYSLN
jgi:carboxypeptidase Taq